MKIVPVREIKKDEIARFDCGIDQLNTFLEKYANQNDRKNIGKTFVCIEDGSIIGYYTLASAQIAFEKLTDRLSKGLPKYPIPCIRIVRLAVDKNSQKEGYGSILLKDALLRIVKLSYHTGICFVIVDAKETSKSFYERYGFMSLNDKELTYILPIETIKKAFK